MSSTSSHARIGILTVSDRAASLMYEDQSGPAIRDVLTEILSTPWAAVMRVVPDGVESVRDAIADLVDAEKCDLVLTTGGTGPALRDLTPEATEAACEKMLPGFGELMRMRNLDHVPTAILSRQTAGIRGRALVVNLPGRPSSIRSSLLAIFGAVPYCLDLIGAARLETVAAIVRAWRPPS